MNDRKKKYKRKSSAINEMIAFTDIGSFLRASFERSKSLVVQKDILNTMFELENSFNGKQLQPIRL